MPKALTNFRFSVPKTLPNSSQKQTGLSLIELLIAMVLGLSLAAGVVQVYVGNSTTERSQEARARLQDNGRFALNFLAQEVRMGGYLGCLSGIDEDTVNSTLAASPNSFQPEFGIQGWEADGTDFGTISNSANNVAVVDTDGGGWGTSGGNILPSINALPDSDIVRIWSAAGTPAIINTVTQGVTPTINIDAITDLQEGDILLLSDCDQADWVQACEIDPAGGGTTSDITLAPASGTCSPGNTASSPITVAAGGEAVRLEGTLLYVGKRGNTATNVPALFRHQLGDDATPGVAEELIEGVESMQIVYGVNLDADSRNTVDSYLAADLITDWRSVISLRISLLMQSVENGVVPAPQPYTFMGVTYDGSAGNGDLAQDRRVRRVFNSTINLRNRALGI